MDKNKDAVPDEHLALLQGAEFNFLVDMIQDNNNSSSGSDSPVMTGKLCSPKYHPNSSPYAVFSRPTVQNVSVW
jgi:hypothetical protein